MHIRLDKHSEHLFAHHRHGWNFCLESFKKNKIARDEDGILCINYIEYVFGKGIEINEDWIGFSHNVPSHSFIEKVWPRNKFPANTSLEEMIKLQNFKNSLKKCKGIFTLSKYASDFLKRRIEVEVESLFHASDLNVKKFDIKNFTKNKDKKIYTIGHWMRNFQSTYDYKTNYKKIIIDNNGAIHNYQLRKNSDVEIIQKINEKEYDDILSENLVFIDFFDVSASNSILECICRNTPIITRRLPANEEYLGKDYPLFFSELFEVEYLFDKIEQAYYYLKNLNLNKFSSNNFFKDFINSNICKKNKIKIIKI